MSVLGKDFEGVEASAAKVSCAATGLLGAIGKRGGRGARRFEGIH